MNLLDRFRSLFPSRGAASVSGNGETDSEPSEAEMHAARRTLDEMVRPAILGGIGGAKPQKNDRATSWWGGNFLGAEGETIPVCARSGRPMHPLLQVRVDELAHRPSALAGIALLSVWVDLADVPLDDAVDGVGISVRIYPDIAGLVPIGPGYRESDALPSFPVRWRERTLEQPGWEDIAGKIPTRVARAKDAGWFFDSRYSHASYEDRAECPIKIGGWPTWIQGARWPADSEFCLQIDSTSKGRFAVGDAGSLYLFRSSDSWVTRSDFY